MRVTSQELEVLVVENPDQVVEIYERHRLSHLLRNQTDSIKHLIEQRFKTLPKLEHLYI